LQGQTPVAGAVVVYSGCEATTTGDGASELVGRRLTTGKQLWARHGTFLVYRADSDTDPHAKVYVANRHGNPVAINSQTGQTLYHLNGGDVVTAVDDQQVYATCGQHTRFCAYNKQTGARVWRVSYSTGEGTGPLAAIGGGVVYLDDGRVLNATNGMLLTRLWSTGRATSLAVGRGHVAAVTDGIHTDVYGLPH
jgi:outer membrane protein assembly factor BamB